MPLPSLNAFSLPECLICPNEKIPSQNATFAPINPIPTEGGRFGPEKPETGWHFHSFMTGVTKIFDFAYFSTCLVPVNLFLKKKYEILKN